jgi:hypothetical protein
MKLHFVAMFLATGVASAADWSLKQSTDAMTDAVRKEAFVTNTEGDKFTIIRRNDGSVWGYFQLAGLNQFSVGERLMLRVDKNKPVEFNEDFEKLTRQLGRPIEAWEWNPGLIGFRLWHGKSDEGCGLVHQLYNGSQLIIRYHPNSSTERDVVFPLGGNHDAIAKAIDLQMSDCAKD